jgi:opacity protein-like surface antigen
MNTRISAMIFLLCVVGLSPSASAEDELPTMSSGTIEPYLSFMAGVAIPNSPDITFNDGTQPVIMQDVNYSMKQSIGGNAGIWFPTRDKLAGLDLGFEITGFVWYPDMPCCQLNANGRNETYIAEDGSTYTGFEGTTTEKQGIYVGGNLMIRYPLGISEAYPNGRWFPYVGIGPGAHQMSMRPGGFRGAGFANAIADQRDTTIGWLAVGGVKGHLFKYVAAFAEAKYVQADHSALSTDRYGLSTPGGQDLTMNDYHAGIKTVFVHAGLSIHFDIRP